jgi:hypothetical protein
METPWSGAASEPTRSGERRRSHRTRKNRPDLRIRAGGLEGEGSAVNAGTHSCVPYIGHLTWQNMISGAKGIRTPDHLLYAIYGRRSNLLASCRSNLRSCVHWSPPEYAPAWCGCCTPLLYTRQSVAASRAAWAIPVARSPKACRGGLLSPGVPDRRQRGDAPHLPAKGSKYGTQCQCCMHLIPIPVQIPVRIPLQMHVRALSSRYRVRRREAARRHIDDNLYVMP